MKNCYLLLRISDDQMRQLEEEAMRRGMTKSELIRHLIAKFPEPKGGD
jgi:Ribbon-helix-helix protein, copG family